MDLVWNCPPSEARAYRFHPCQSTHLPAKHWFHVSSSAVEDQTRTRQTGPIFQNTFVQTRSRTLCSDGDMFVKSVNKNTECTNAHARKQWIVQKFMNVVFDGIPAPHAGARLPRWYGACGSLTSQRLVQCTNANSWISSIFVFERSVDFLSNLNSCHNNTWKSRAS